MHATSNYIDYLGTDTCSRCEWSRWQRRQCLVRGCTQSVCRSGSWDCPVHNRLIAIVHARRRRARCRRTLHANDARVYDKPLSRVLKKRRDTWRPVGGVSGDCPLKILGCGKLSKDLFLVGQFLSKIGKFWVTLNFAETLGQNWNFKHRCPHSSEIRSVCQWRM